MRSLRRLTGSERKPASGNLARGSCQRRPGMVVQGRACRASIASPDGTGATAAPNATSTGGILLPLNAFTTRTNQAPRSAAAATFGAPYWRSAPAARMMLRVVAGDDALRPAPRRDRTPPLDSISVCRPSLSRCYSGTSDQLQISQSRFMSSLLETRSELQATAKEVCRSLLTRNPL
jgi:hypothetical protein